MTKLLERPKTSIDWEMFKTFTQAPGAPGFESEMRDLMKSYLREYADEIIQDRLGGIYGVKRGNLNGPKILVAGHMDEVAFMITRITDGGFLKFQPLGGWWSHVLLAQRVNVMTSRGKKLPGIIGSIPVHLLESDQRDKLVPTKQMFIDIGAENKEQVEEWGIRPGDVAIPVSPYTELEGGKRVMSKAWDNRLGCGIAIELLSSLEGEAHPNNIYAGATVQEEVGLRGAAPAANLIKPDLFFAVDVGPAGDTLGVQDGFGKIGKGMLIRVYDRSMITLPGVRDFLLDIAEKEKIPYQFFISPGGGTDAGRVHLTGEGVPSVAIGVVARYIHSHAAIIDKEDVEATKAFVYALTKALDRSTYESILRH